MIKIFFFKNKSLICLFKKIKKDVVLCSVIFVLLSCNRNSIEKQLADFYGTEIVFPEKMHENLHGRDTLMQFNDVPFKMIVWYDSAECSSCHIQHI